MSKTYLTSTDTHDHERGASASKQDDDHDFVNFVDVILEDQDLNKDGYISYPEYVTFMNKQLEKMKEENKQRGHEWMKERRTLTHSQW